MSIGAKIFGVMDGNEDTRFENLQDDNWEFLHLHRSIHNIVYCLNHQWNHDRVTAPLWLKIQLILLKKIH